MNPGDWEFCVPENIACGKRVLNEYTGEIVVGTMPYVTGVSAMFSRTISGNRASQYYYLADNKGYTVNTALNVPSITVSQPATYYVYPNASASSFVIKNGNTVVKTCSAGPIAEPYVFTLSSGTKEIVFDYTGNPATFLVMFLMYPTETNTVPITPDIVRQNITINKITGTAILNNPIIILSANGTAPAGNAFTKTAYASRGEIAFYPGATLNTSFGYFAKNATCKIMFPDPTITLIEYPVGYGTLDTTFENINGTVRFGTASASGFGGIMVSAK